MDSSTFLGKDTKADAVLFYCISVCIHANCLHLSAVKHLFFSPWGCFFIIKKAFIFTLQDL